VRTSVRRIRAIDPGAGLRGAHRFLKIIGMPSHDADRAARAACAPAISAPRRVLVREVNWLGDLVMSLPALRAIRRAWPSAHLSVLVKRELAGFFDGARWIDEVIPYALAHGPRRLADSARIIARVRAGRFDLAVLFPNSFSSALWAALARVPERAGYLRDGRGPLLTRASAPPADAMEGHQVRYWLAMVRETLGIEAGSGDLAGDLAVDVHGPHLQHMREWLGARRRNPDGALVAIAPAAAYGPAKQWPAERFAALIGLIGDRFGAECVLVGAPSERALCDELARSARGGPAVAAGETGIGELIALLSLCDGFIGNDSGCMHVAAALGVATVGLFGSTNPARTGPLGQSAAVVYKALECSPCLARTCRFGHYNCLKSIEPAEAVYALERLGAFRRHRDAQKRVEK
jgi:heptosyltransferase-2